MHQSIIRISLAFLSCSVFASASLAQSASAEQQTAEAVASGKKARVKVDETGAFELGKITIAGLGRDGKSSDAVSQTVVNADEIRNSNRDTLDDALRTVPGVEVSNSGGSRNERLIFVRGFDRWQVPLYIDGVRIYLPADNRLDYGRFLTPDLAEIQIQKGYVPVLSGPGGMGGAINLVTRTPTKALEGELQTGLEVGNTGKLASYKTYGSIGTRQDLFYLQASGSMRKSDGWFLPRDFDANLVEDGGRRDFSDVRDWRGNLKVGITPNATDEYVVSYTRQAGEKGAPYAVNQAVRGLTPTANYGIGTTYQRDWTWPRWDIGTLSFNSHTEIGEASYLETKAFYNTFDNLLSAYDDSTFSTQTQPRSFDSYYDDYAYGFSAEAGTELIDRNSLKAAIHYRRDSHKEWQHSRPDASSFVEPKQQQIEDTWSVAVEDTFHLTDALDLVAGVSYDRNKLKKAEDYASNAIFSYPLGGSDAFNWQTAAIWRPSEVSELHASVSSRTRFPNMFERFSTRFGTAVPNPDLKPERAINFEIGAATELTDDLRVSGAVFYSDVKDAIQSIGIGNALVQNQNIGDGQYYGIEAKAEWDVLDQLTLGGNYTYLKRDITDPVRPNLRSVGVPEHLLYVYGTWTPTEKLSMTGSLEASSSRWSDNPAQTGYIKTTGFVLANVNLEYKFTEQYSANFGVRNIFDRNYELVTGFPEAGRTFYLNSRITF